MLSVSEVIQKSSNVGTVKIAMKMTPKDIWEMYTQVGFGQKPQIAFPGAVAGRLRPYKTWRPLEQATMSYGYGLSTSLFQLAQAYTVFARDGEVVPVSLIKREERAVGVRAISAQNAVAVRNMLNMVTGPGGTAPRAQTMGYSVGGKTGTAHKQEGKGYAAKKYRGFFVGMAPIETPRIVVAVMIDEPSNGRYFGGDVAAPVFSETVQQTLRMLGIQPDRAVKPQVITQAEVESF
jgi:cell division protein FtsI (penicillin-binding protein 3)